MPTELGIARAKPEPRLQEATLFVVAFLSVADVSAITRAQNRRSHRLYGGSHHAAAARIKSAAQDPFPTQAKLSATAASSSDETEAPHRRPRTALV